MSISQGTVTVLSEKLAIKGFLTRTKSEQDKRKFILSLTDQGIAAINSAPDMLQEKQSYLVGALERVALMLDADEIDAAPVLDIGQISTLPLPTKKDPDN